MKCLLMACVLGLIAACGQTSGIPSSNAAADRPVVSATPTQTANPTPTTPLYAAASTPTGGGVIPGGQWVSVQGPNGTVMLAQVFTPSGNGPFPAVLVLHGTEGFVQHHTQLAQLLSQNGFVGVAACWFSGHFNGSTPSRDSAPPSYNNPLGIDCPQAPPFVALSGGTTWPEAVTAINDLGAAVRTLPHVNPKMIGLIGHSRGSIAALTVAAQGASVQAVVAADGTPATSYASQEVGSILLIQGLSDTTVSPQTTMAYEADLKSAGKSVQDDYVAGAPHTLIWEAPWQVPAQTRAITFLQQILG